MSLMFIHFLECFLFLYIYFLVSSFVILISSTVSPFFFSFTVFALLASGFDKLQYVEMRNEDTDRDPLNPSGKIRCKK